VNEKAERFFNSGQCFQHSSPLLLPSDYKVLVRELKEQLIPGFKQFLVTVKLGPHNVRERGSRSAREVVTVPIPKDGSPITSVPNPFKHFLCYQYFTDRKAPHAIEVSCVVPGSGTHLDGVNLQEGTFKQLKREGGLMCKNSLSESALRIMGNVRVKNPVDPFAYPFGFMWSQTVEYVRTSKKTVRQLAETQEESVFTRGPAFADSEDANRAQLIVSAAKEFVGRFKGTTQSSNYTEIIQVSVAAVYQELHLREMAGEDCPTYETIGTMGLPVVKNFFLDLGAGKWFFTYGTGKRLNPWGFSNWSREKPVAVLLRDAFTEWAKRVKDVVFWKVDVKTKLMVSTEQTGAATAAGAIATAPPLTTKSADSIIPGKL
jgi:hypothetical protein